MTKNSLGAFTLSVIKTNILMRCFLSFSETSSQASSRDRASHVTGAVFLSSSWCQCTAVQQLQRAREILPETRYRQSYSYEKKELSGDLTMLLTLLFISTGKNIHIPRIFFCTCEAVV